MRLDKDPERTIAVGFALLHQRYEGFGDPERTLAVGFAPLHYKDFGDPGR